MKGHATYVVKDGDTLSSLVDKFKSGELFPNTYFEVDEELTAEMVWDDHKNKDPYAIRWSGNQKKDNKEQMCINPGELLYLPYLNTVIDVNLPNGIAADASFFTGDTIKVTPYAFRPIVDAHMHIQSLHATPMTLQWATTFRGMYGMLPFGKRQIAGAVSGTVQNDTINAVVEFVTRDEEGSLNGRKGVTGMAAALTNLGKIGRFSTDLVAKIYMNDVKNNEMKASLFWMLWSKDKIKELIGKEENLEEKAGKELGLEKLVEERSEDLQDFYKSTAYYFHKNQVLHMSIVMPMDLSYGHFWGAHGLPINLPVKGNNTFHYIDDFVQISVDRRIESFWFSKKLYVDNIFEPANSPDNHLYHMNYKFDLKEQLKNYLNFMGNRCGLDDYNESDAEEPFLLVFEYDTLNSLIKEKEDKIEDKEDTRDRERRRVRGREAKDQVSDRYNNEIEEIRKSYNEKFKEALNSIEDKYKAITEKEYKHYLNNIPDDNSEIFEDYYLQRAYTEASAFRYPLQLITFYHYEPRRYYVDKSKLKEFAEKVDDYHGFYKLTPKEFKHDDSTPDINQRADLSIIELKGDKGDKGEKGDYFLEMFKGKTKKKSRAKTPDLNVKGSLEIHDDMIKNLYPNGCFMGAKVYPALGYPGDLYDWDVHDGGLYYDKQFDSLKKLFDHCIKNNLPVTSHCSPLGMSISDGFNYEIRDDFKKAMAKAKAKGEKLKYREGIREFHDVIDSALYVDKICGRPTNWRRVLEYDGGDYDFKKLKLCLAHFGGMENWALTEEEREKKRKKGELKPDWRKLICELIDEFDNIYTDISCYTMELGRIPRSFSRYKWNNDIISNDKLSVRDKEILNRYYKYERHPHMGSNYYMLKAYNEEEKALVRAVLRSIGYINDKIDVIGDYLVKAINDYPDLKERILMGSDWYMAEMSITGAGNYYTRMFELLKYITKKLDDKYDVWHQFSVVNPLNYLGFLKGDDKGTLETEKYNGKDVYIVDIERIETLLKNLNTRTDADNSNWRKFADITESEELNFTKLSERRLHQLKNCKIYTAEEIKKDDKLIITHGQQVL